MRRRSSWIHLVSHEETTMARESFSRLRMKENFIVRETSVEKKPSSHDTLEGGKNFITQEQVISFSLLRLTLYGYLLRRPMNWGCTESSLTWTSLHLGVTHSLYFRKWISLGEKLCLEWEHTLNTHFPMFFSSVHKKGHRDNTIPMYSSILKSTWNECSAWPILFFTPEVTSMNEKRDPRENLNLNYTI
jgi:hypothetical protein